jgi:hypothetical protein
MLNLKPYFGNIEVEQKGVHNIDCETRLIYKVVHSFIEIYIHHYLPEDEYIVVNDMVSPYIRTCFNLEEVAELLRRVFTVEQE